MAAELLARVIETVGLDCKVGQDAALLLGFCQHGNISESLRIWSVLVTVPSLSKDVAVRTRKMVADMLVTHGEYDAAIREYERFAADYRADEDPKVRTLAEVALQTADNVRRQMKGD
ncbi:MAG TPA: hypothetical protein VFY93_04990 [Planctomycetota bacterium]|nr:hypothetical protein [Planctomycetota bacterium]